MCQNGIDLHGLMLAVEQLSGRGENLKQDIHAWADYLAEQGLPEASASLKNAAESLTIVSGALAEVLDQLHHLHDHGHDHGDHITATSFAE